MGGKGNLGTESPLVAAMAGVSIFVVSTAIYASEQGVTTVMTPERAAYLSWVAVAYLLALLTGATLMALGLWSTVKTKIRVEAEQGFAALSPGWLLPHVLSVKKYKRFFVASTVLYGLFYAVITSMVVYQPTVDFIQAYGAAIPSAVITPCCGGPLYSPVVTVYLVNHLGLLLIPLTAILLVVISVLVGLNFILAIFAFDSRAKGVGKTWIGGIGAIVGLFTGCPTCAGLFFANFLGGAGAVSFSTALAYYQPVFIGLSLPVLAFTPYMISRSLAKVYREGCVWLGPERATPGPTG